MFVIPFVTRLGIISSWDGWSITRGFTPNPGIGITRVWPCVF
ncbi:hypothetical protein DCAR_0313405 [Daucus carota subsp. sativus]|uniref:Uncharacterized protein n=1 Tax=Daucus carota subsp. sativus TaxID=79200 RepID=A0AAF1AUY9_DAUCS|nr:hypothetical protein DCAR_0313405 [Daucus carota subsp. sativus]